MDSILTSIKKLLGIIEDDTSFDTDIIIHINSVFMILYQLGIGEEGFYIEDSTATWSDYLGDQINLLSSVRSYIYLKVRLLFDPPSSSANIESISNLISELEWRLNVAVDPGEE